MDVLDQDLKEKVWKNKSCYTDLIMRLLHDKNVQVQVYFESFWAYIVKSTIKVKI